MSRLLIVARPAYVPGFRLAGVDAFPAEDVDTAHELIEAWLEANEAGLLAIDDGLLERLDASLLKRLDGSEQLLYMAIPGGQPLGPEASRRHRVAEMIRQAIGFHITFKGEEVEER